MLPMSNYASLLSVNHFPMDLDLVFCCSYLLTSENCHEFVGIMATVVLYLIPHITYSLMGKLYAYRFSDVHALTTKGDYRWLLVLIKNQSWLLVLTKNQGRLLVLIEKSKRWLLICGGFSPLYKIRAYCLNDKFLTSGIKGVARTRESAKLQLL